MIYLGSHPACSTDVSTFEGTQHDTLNFETCGGESSSPDDLSPDQMGQLLHFPAKAAESRRNESTKGSHHVQ